VVLEALGYNPSKHFRKITAPVWFRVALKDHLCPSSVVLAAIRGSGLPDSRYTVQVGN
jgi:cephalosporin-C deacetylase-like acetyl esterase